MPPLGQPAMCGGDRITWAWILLSFGTWSMMESKLILIFYTYYRVWWWVWDKKTATSVTKPSPNVVFWLWNTPLNMVSSPTGTIWRRSGITPSTMNCVLPPRNTPSFSLRLPSTPRPTVKRWPRYCNHRTVRSQLNWHRDFLEPNT